MEAERERRISLQLACDKALVEERQARQRQASAALDAERVRRITVLREVEELTGSARAAQVRASSRSPLSPLISLDLAGESVLSFREERPACKCS